MRDIDMLDLRWHKGEPTWDIIDQLIEMIDASPSEEEIENRVREAGYDTYRNGWDDGYDSGYDSGVGDGFHEGYGEGYDDGKEEAGD